MTCFFDYDISGISNDQMPVKSTNTICYRMRDRRGVDLAEQDIEELIIGPIGSFSSLSEQPEL
jgi:hypothetical protein